MPRWCRTFRLLTCSAIALSVFAPGGAIVLGQDSKSSGVASLRTIISDPEGAVIPNAAITFKGEQVVAANTGQDGSVRVQLPYGSYSVLISRPGFETFKIVGLAIESAKHTDLHVILHVAPYCDDCLTENEIGPRTIPSELPNTLETVRVPDAATALSIAEPVLIKVYGKRQIDYEKPLTAKLENGLWKVYGTLCCPDSKGQRTCETGKCLGGTAALALRPSDGKILSITHPK